MPKRCRIIDLGFAIIVIALFLTGCGTGSQTPVQTPGQTQTRENTETTTKQEYIHSSEAKTEPPKEPETDPYVGNKTKFTDLRLGEIAKVDDYYIALHYVKRMSYLPTVLDNEAASPGCDVIIAFFEFYNGSDNVVEFDPMDLTGYVDGTLASQVQTNINTFADGVGQYYGAKLDPGYRLMSCQDIEVEDGWKEIKFFYNAECVWTLAPEDVQEENYAATSYFETLKTDTVTPVGTKMITDGYTVEYKGHTKTHIDDSWSSGNFIMFFFHVTNNSSTNLSTGLWGYRMRAYQDGLLLGQPRRLYNVKVDKYIGFSDIEEIAPGMSADIFVAFDYETQKDSDWVMVYDDGYITPHYCGIVFVSESENSNEKETESAQDQREEVTSATEESSIGKHVGTYWLYQIRGKNGTIDPDELVEKLGKTGEFATLELLSDGSAVFDIMTEDQPLKYDYMVNDKDIVFTSETETVLGKIYDGIGSITISIDEDTVWEFFKE